MKIQGDYYKKAFIYVNMIFIMAYLCLILSKMILLCLFYAFLFVILRNQNGRFNIIFVSLWLYVYCSKLCF